jgi:hypothetical protein
MGAALRHEQKSRDVAMAAAHPGHGRSVTTRKRQLSLQPLPLTAGHLA